MAADRIQRGCRRRDPVGLLDPKLRGAADRRDAVGNAREQGHERQLVDEERHERRLDVGRHELGRPHLDVRDRLAAGKPAAEDADPGPHPLHDREQACAGGVHADVAQRQVRARERGARDDERRRRGEVARHVDLPETELLGGRDGHPARAPVDGDARRAQHALGVVTGGDRLDHLGDAAAGEEAGQQNAGLDLGRRDRELVGDRLGPAPSGDADRRPPAGGLDVHAHPPQRLGDPLHRPRADARVAGQLEHPLLARQDARKEPDERPRVPDVDRPVRRCEPAQARAVDDEVGLAGLLDLDPERLDRGDRRERVGRGAEPTHMHRAGGDRAQKHRPVADRLVAGYGELAREPACGVDAEPRLVHASTAGVATAP